jgi:hypothetical protein
LIAHLPVRLADGMTPVLTLVVLSLKLQYGREGQRISKHAQNFYVTALAHGLVPGTGGVRRR